MVCREHSFSLIALKCSHEVCLPNFAGISNVSKQTCLISSESGFPTSLHFVHCYNIQFKKNVLHKKSWKTKQKNNTTQCIAVYLYTTTPQKGENKKLEVRGKQNNTAKQEEAVSLFSVLYCIPQHLLFSTRAAINANVQRGECRENNYPLPQPAGLFINMQLWFHGSPLYTSHSRAQKKTSAKAPSMKTS